MTKVQSAQRFPNCYECQSLHTPFVLLLCSTEHGGQDTLKIVEMGVAGTQVLPGPGGHSTQPWGLLVCNRCTECPSNALCHGVRPSFQWWPVSLYYNVSGLMRWHPHLSLASSVSQDLLLPQVPSQGWTQGKRVPHREVEGKLTMMSRRSDGDRRHCHLPTVAAGMQLWAAPGPKVAPAPTGSPSRTSPG